MRMRYIRIVGLFTVLLVASFLAGCRGREDAQGPKGKPVVAQKQPEDIPITISDGSPLKIHMKKFGWIKRLSNEIEPNVSGTVTAVSITPGSHPLDLCAGGHECEVDITYGTIQLQVTTDLDGQWLRVKTIRGAFADHYDTPDPNTYKSKIKNAAISLVIVKKDGTEVQRFVPPPKITTTVEIIYTR